MNRTTLAALSLSLTVGCTVAPRWLLPDSGPNGQGAAPGTGIAPTSGLALSSHSTDSVTITGLFPSQAKVGDTITIAGTNFSETAASNSVVFTNNITATPATADVDSLVVVVPASASTGLLRVDVAGVPSNNFHFTVNPMWAPAISSVSPSQALPGSSITIYGSGFSRPTPRTTWSTSARQKSRPRSQTPTP